MQVADPFFAKFTTEHLERALEARKRELEDGSPSRRAEAARAIHSLEKELTIRRGDEKLIEVKIPKASLFLTVEEYVRGLKRGKAIKRHRSLENRIRPGKGLKNEAVESFLSALK